MSLLIAGIGTAVPEYQIEQSDAAEQASQLSCQTLAQQRLLKTLYRRAGVHTRHSVLLESCSNGSPAQQSFYTATRPEGPSTAERMAVYASHASPLAMAAARRALVSSDVEPGEISHLITVSCSGFSAPGVDLALLAELGFHASTSRTHIGFMGCHGALNGLRVARAYATADAAARVLMCAVELCSLHHQYQWQPGQIVANSLFADGAAAVVVRTGDGLHDGWHVVDQRSVVIPCSTELMNWRIGNHGFQMSLSPQVPQVICDELRPWLDAWLAEHDLDVEQVGSWAIHPGGPRILEACATAMSLDPAVLADSQEILGTFGNMSSPTVLFILDRLRCRGAPRPTVMLAFGPGLTIEAALLL
jgi:predicted naringenin-chalcone synthase